MLTHDMNPYITQLNFAKRQVKLSKKIQIRKKSPLNSSPDSKTYTVYMIFPILKNQSELIGYNQ